MIPNFPTPRPDELLYSVVARYGWLAHFPNNRLFRRQIFGEDDAKPAIDFPARIGAIQTAYGPDSPWDVAQIIQAMTLLPYYGPFISPTRLERLKMELRGNDDTGHVGKVSRLGQGVPRHPYLRFCPSCVAEERQETGESYWHRLPQLPGVHVCPIHHVFLEDTSIPVFSGTTMSTFIAAEDSILPRASRKLDPANLSHMTLLRLAKSAATLTGCALGGSEGEILRQRYVVRAMQLRYASATGSMLWAKIIPDFRERYSEELLQLLASVLPAGAPRNRDHWIANILQKATEMQAPIRHLLLMDFLGLGSQEFFNPDTDSTVLGAGPWECENTFCPKFRERVIVEMRFEQSTAHQCPLGLLTCPECGQERAHIDVDGSTRSRVRNYGPLWYDALKQFWSDATMGIGVLAARLGVMTNTAESHAAKIDLPFPRIGPKGVSSRSEPRLRLKRERQTKELLKKKRSEWLVLRATNPTKSITELLDLAEACYTFLHKRDREWLRCNSPACRRRPPPPQPTVDWNIRDQKLSVEVVKAVLELRMAKGIPKLLTITAIGLKLGKLSLLQKYISKLPLTKAVLYSKLETTAEFACRKIVWEASCLRQERVNFDRQDLVLRARLASATLRYPTVLTAIDTELTYAPIDEEVRSVELAA